MSGAQFLPVRFTAFCQGPACDVNLNVEDQMATRPLLIFAITLLLIGTSTPLWAQQNPMSFFVTSVGVGNGGDLGGLYGADRHWCGPMV